MASLRTDSPLSRRVVRAFLDFLNSVEPAPGIDIEGLEVVRECLEEVFRLNSSSDEDQIKPNLLVELFRSPNLDKQNEAKPDLSRASMPVEAPSTSLAPNVGNGCHSETSKSLNDEQVGDPHISGVSEDELFGQFCGALENIHFFKPTAAGDDDHVQLDKAKGFFDAALLEMEKCGCQTYNSNNLAEALKSLGNEAMKAKLFFDAVELYTCAIALFENNAVYFCNRAAAYTQLQKYAEAIADCNRAIEINPNYSKAYSRLGFVYYELGKYCDAINKGFLKALQLDPNSSSIRENIQAAEQKLREEMQQAEQDQNAGPNHTQEPNSHATAGSSHGVPPFTSMPFSASLPSDFANILMSMAGNANPDSQQGRVNSRSRDSNGLNEPEITLGGNINFSVGEGSGVNVNIGQELPDIMGAWRSMMDMFPQQGPPGDRRP